MTGSWWLLWVSATNETGGSEFTWGYVHNERRNVALAWDTRRNVALAYEIGPGRATEPHVAEHVAGLRAYLLS